MKKNLLIIVLAVLFLVGWTAQSSRVQWEYKVVNSNKGTPPKDINELGAEGWELIAIRNLTFSGNSINAEYIFKRAK